MPPEPRYFTLASDDDVDSFHQTPLTLTTDRMQPFYSLVRTYLRLLIVAGLMPHFSFWRYVIPKHVAIGLGRCGK